MSVFKDDQVTYTGNVDILGTLNVHGTLTVGGDLDLTGSIVINGQVLPRSYIGGLTLSTAGASSTFSVAIGQTADSTNLNIMTLQAAISKTTSAWAVGTGNGSLDTGAIANTTWYHVYLIQRIDTDVVDVLTSLSVSAPTMPANYTLFRRIGSMKTDGSAHWIKFIQLEDEFLWDVPVGDANALAVGTAGNTVTMTVPPGVQVDVLFNAVMASNTVGTLVVYHSLDQTAQVANTPLGNFQLFIAVANTNDAGQLSIRTNTSAQIRVVSNATVATCQNYIATQGWIDMRGKAA